LNNEGQGILTNFPGRYMEREREGGRVYSFSMFTLYLVVQIAIVTEI